MADASEIDFAQFAISREWLRDAAAYGKGAVLSGAQKAAEIGRGVAAVGASKAAELGRGAVGEIQNALARRMEAKKLQAKMQADELEVRIGVDRAQRLRMRERYQRQKDELQARLNELDAEETRRLAGVREGMDPFEARLLQFVDVVMAELGLRTDPSEVRTAVAALSRFPEFGTELIKKSCDGVISPRDLLVKLGLSVADANRALEFTDPAQIALLDIDNDELRRDVESVIRVRKTLEAGYFRGSKCSLDVRSSLMPQQWLSAVLMWPELPFRGFAVLDPVGAGKTCRAIAAINSLVAAARLGRNGAFNKIHIIVPKDGIKKDFFRDIQCNCGSQHVREAFTAASTSHSQSDTVPITVPLIGNPGQTVTITVSFFVLTWSSRRPSSFEDSYVLWDESQNAKNPKTNNTGKDNAAIVYDLINKTRRVKILLMSATFVENRPGDVCILNVVKPRNEAGAIINAFPDDRDYMRDQSGASTEEAKDKRDAEFLKMFSTDGQSVDVAKLLKWCDGLTTNINLERIGAGFVYPQVRVNPTPTLVRWAGDRKGDIAVEPRSDLSLSRSAEEEQSLAANVRNNKMSAIDNFDVFLIQDPGQKDPEPGSHLQFFRGKTKDSRMPSLKLLALLRNIEQLASEEGMKFGMHTERANKQAVFIESTSASEFFQSMLISKGIARSIIRVDDLTSSVSSDGGAEKWVSSVIARGPSPRRWCCIEKGSKGSDSFLSVRQNAIINLWNSPQNKRGEYVCGIIFGRTSREGRSFYGTTHMHLPMGTARMRIVGERLPDDGPLSNRGMRTQVLGRITRFKSHCDLGAGPENQYVRFLQYVYFSPSAETRDLDAHRRSGEESPADIVLSAMTQAAIDVDLFEGHEPLDMADPFVFLSQYHKQAVCFDSSWPSKIRFQPPSRETDMLAPEDLWRMWVPVFRSSKTATMQAANEENAYSILPDVCRKSSSLNGFVRFPAQWSIEHERVFVHLWTGFLTEQRQRAANDLSLSRRWSRPILRAILRSLVTSSRDVSSAAEAKLECVDKGVVIVLGGVPKLIVLNSAFGHADLTDITDVDSASGVIRRLGRDMNSVLLQAMQHTTSLPAYYPLQDNNTGFEPEFVPEVERSLLARGEDLRSGRQAMWAVFSRGSNEWTQAFDEWASHGLLPLKGVELASVNERRHLLWIMLHIRGALLSRHEQSSIFARCLLEQEIGKADAMIASLAD